MSCETVPVLQLMQTSGVGPRTIARLFDRLEQDNLTLQDFVALEPEAMVDRFGLKEDQALAIREHEERAARLADLLTEHNVTTLLRGDVLYPARLKTTLGDKAPPVLFVAGSTELLQARGVGFCGARDASPLGLHRAEEIARSLATEGLLVISGHAQGVDEAAHRGALEAGGKTALVLPEGILQFRPRPSIAALLDENFVVISEFPPTQPWSVASAMQRNRTICGLVNALIVIEAGTSGGTWEAGKTALDLGVPLFALDFPEPSAAAQGNSLLLKRGGRPLPCRPGEAPDLSLLVDAMSRAVTKASASQASLFD